MAAVDLAVDRLRAAPDNKKAKEILAMSYPEAVRILDTEVRNAAAANSPDRWQVAVRNYSLINRLYETIQRSPAAMKVIPQPQERFNLLSEARGKAAEELYQAGLQLMLKATREDSKRAYLQFNRALELVPEYKDALEYATQAKEDATLNVLVMPVVVNHPGWNLESAIFGYRGNQFVRFLVPDQVRRDSIKRIDQYLELSINGYAQALPIFNRRVQEHVDSVKTGEKKVNGKVVAVMSVVNARTTTIEKVITATGSARLRLVDARTETQMALWEIPSTQRWSDQWVIYTGDIRAMPNSMRQLTERRETWPQENQLKNMVRQDLERKIAGQVAEFYRSY